MAVLQIGQVAARHRGLMNAGTVADGAMRSGSGRREEERRSDQGSQQRQKNALHQGTLVRRIQTV
jgi:hypothetical protein